MKLKDIQCDMCGRKLILTGGILFGKPFEIAHLTVCRKTHLCQSCACIVQIWISNRRKKCFKKAKK